MVSFKRSRRKSDPRSASLPDEPGKLGKAGKKGKTGKSGAADRTAPLPASAIYALMGATGGVGTTTAACALAVDLARREVESRPGLSALSSASGEPHVCLIDFDFEAGACAHHLDLLPTLSHDDLQRPSSEMDPTFVSSMIDQTVAGVALISAANGGASTLGGSPNPRTVLALLDAASQLFDHVVVDLPRQLQPWTLAVLAGADTSMILCEMTVPSLHMARLRRAQVGPALSQRGGKSLLPVIAKQERRGGRGTLQRSDVATALGEDAFGQLPFDPEPLRAVINSGEPLATTRPDCRYMKELRTLSDRLFAYIEDTSPEQVAASAGQAA